MSTAKGASLRGVIHGEVRSWTSQKGTPCAEFVVRLKDGGLTRCMCFKDLADEATSKCKKDSSIYVMGRWSDSNKDCLMVDALSVAGEGPSHKDRLIREHGSIEKYREHLRAKEEEWKAQGLVQARQVDGTVRWHKKDACVEVDGEWWSQTDFVVHMLGNEVVNSELIGVIRAPHGLTTERLREKQGELLERALKKYWEGD
jgi:hypothetical protein